MNSAKYKTLLVGGSICLVLAIVATVFLFRFKGQADQNRSKVEKAVQAVKGLKRAAVYPTDANAVALREEKDRFEKHYADLRLHLRDGQAEPIDVPASRFGIHVAEFRKRLTNPQQVEIIKAEEATRAGVGPLGLSMLEGDRVPAPEVVVKEEAAGHRTKVAEGFGFSFDDYIVKGRRPKNAEISRLTLQMQLVERLCLALYDAGVEEVVGIEREVFEIGAQGFAGGDFTSGGSRDLLGDDLDEEEGDEAESLFTTEDFRIEFTAREPGVWAALNALADENGNIVVRAVELSNKSTITILQPNLAEARGGSFSGGSSRAPRRAPRRKSGTGGEKGTAPITLPGNELVQVILDVQAILFKADADAAGVEDEGVNP